jgi:hypothetical protein
MAGSSGAGELGGFSSGGEFVVASEDLRFPIGEFRWPDSVSPVERLAYLERVAAAPVKLRMVVSDLSAEQLDTRYRDGGWTVRQVIHHVPDSHMNSYVRFKLALTETEPTIKPYDEGGWASLGDTPSTPVETSLCLLECLHERWVNLMRSMSEAEWARTFRHPALGLITLEKNLALYAWHGDHHVEHIAALRRRNGWFAIDQRLPQNLV